MQLIPSGNFCVLAARYIWNGHKDHQAEEEMSDSKNNRLRMAGFFIGFISL